MRVGLGGIAGIELRILCCPKCWTRRTQFLLRWYLKIPAATSGPEEKGQRSERTLWDNPAFCRSVVVDDAWSCNCNRFTPNKNRFVFGAGDGYGLPPLHQPPHSRQEPLSSPARP